MAQTINEAGLALIRKYEGLHLLCFDDGTGIATIGYGHTQTIKPADIGKKKITKKQAQRLLKKDILLSERMVERYISVKLNENQFAALVCFTFNSGALSLKESTLCRQLNTGDYDSVPAELARWVKSDGKTLASLVKRRLAESNLFTDSVDAAVRDDFILARRPDTPDDNHAHIVTGYLSDKNILLERGSVDDNGSVNYLYLNQNVPDGYVVALQKDMIALGFSGTAVDGAFGIKTRSSLITFQFEAKIDASGIVDESTKDAIILWLENGYSKNNLPGSDAHFIEYQPGIQQMIVPPVQHFSQGDPRWGSRVLGRSSSISKQGCAISCVAMILHFYGRNANPASLDEYLEVNDGYSGNSVIWDIAGRFNESHGNKLKYYRQTGSLKSLVKIIKDRIKQNRPTIARVDYGTDSNLIYNHFVLCVGISDDGSIMMNDPASHYGNAYKNSGKENTIQKTSRKNSYTIVGLDYYDPLN